MARKSRKPTVSQALPPADKTATDTPKEAHKSLSAAFTPVVTAKQPTAARVRKQAASQVGALPKQDKGVTPEQTFDTTLNPSAQPTAASAVQDQEMPPISTSSKVLAS